MSVLLEIREKLTGIYSKGEVFILPFLKFVLCMMCITMINSKLGFMYKITSPAIAIIVSALCSFLPANMIIIFSAMFIVLHMYALSLESAVIVSIIFLLMFLLYFRFAPRDALAVLLTPLCFALNIPYAVPLSAGFVGNPLSSISVGCGVIVYYVIGYFSDNASTLSNLDLESTVAKLKYIVDALLSNRVMIVMVAVFAVTVVLVYVVRRLSVDYSWRIALVLGVIACFAMTFMGGMIMDINISPMSLVVGMVLSVIVVIILQFFVFCVDYSRVENVQFEDDEYYYYVKAVPKISVPNSDKKVKRINSEFENLDKVGKHRKKVEKTEIIDDDDVRVVRKNRLE